jgi:hypothetical protein
MKRYVLALVMGAGLSCAALAEPGKDDAPKDAPLGGPKVAERKEVTSLVQRGFDGKVQRVGGAPEIAALRLLKLVPEERKGVEAITTQRAKVLDAFVSDNLPMLTDFQSLAAIGDKKQTLKALSAAAPKLKDLWKDGSLQVQVRAALPADKREKFDALIDEYWKAVIDERLAAGEKEDDGKPKSRLSIMIDERLKSLGKEIEQSFQRVLYSGDLIYKIIAKDLTLTAQQEAEIRQLCAEYASVTKLNPTKEQEKSFGLKVLGKLTNEQQLIVIERFKGMGKRDPK